MLFYLLVHRNKMCFSFPLLLTIFAGIFNSVAVAGVGQTDSTAGPAIAILKAIRSTQNSITFGYDLHGSLSVVDRLIVTVVDQQSPDTSNDYTLDLTGNSYTVDSLRSSTRYSFLPQSILKNAGASVLGPTIYLKTLAAVVDDNNKGDKDSEGPGVGTIVGIVVGCVLGIALIAVAFFIGFKCLKRKEKKVEYRAADNKNYTVPDDENQVQIEAEWKDKEDLLARDGESALPPEAKRRLQFGAGATDREAAAPLAQPASAVRQETAAVRDAPAGYRRSYADADVIPRGPSLKYRESLREVTRDKYRNRRQQGPLQEDDDSDDETWYQNGDGNGKRYPQHSFPTPQPQGYAQPAQGAYQPPAATHAPPPAMEDPRKGQGKRLPKPPSDQELPAYSEERPANFRTQIANRYGQDESAL